MERKFWKLVGLSSAHLFAVQMILPLLSPYFSSLGISDSMISLLFGIFPLVVMFSANLVGELSQQIGRYWTIKIALIIEIIAYVLYFLGIPAGLVVARIIDALAFITIEMLLLAKAEDIIENAQRGRMTGIKMSVETVLRMFGPVLGGILADIWIGWPFFISIGIFTSLVLCLRDKQLHMKREHIHLHPWRNLKMFIMDPDLRPLAILGPFAQGMAPAFNVVIPLYVVKTLGLSYTEVGVIAMALAAGHTLQFGLGQLSDVFGSRKFMILGVFGVIAPMVLVALAAPSYPILIAVSVLQGVFSALWNVTAWSYMSEIAEKTDDEGLVIGAYLSIAKIGQTTSYFGISAVIAFAGYMGALLLLGIVGLVGVAIAALMFLDRWTHKPVSS